MRGPPEQISTAAIRKTMWRLVPFLGLIYLISFLDRVNIGYAALTMNRDLGLSATEFGIGASVFFTGYILLEVPSNLLLHRYGARFWIARIMVSWGLVSAAMAFAAGPASFYALRFLLGIAEAGFFPGMILYLTQWFPAADRTRIVGAFMMALPLSTVIGAPISTALLDLRGLGLEGWQWLFVLEGVPAVLAGIAVLYVLEDDPRKAAWLTGPERDWLVETLAEEARDRETRHSIGVRRALLDLRIWGFGLIYFSIVIGVYGLSLWYPQIVKAAGGLSNRQVGALTAFPYLLAAIAMYAVGRSSDRTGDRVAHVALPAFLGAIGLGLSAWSGNDLLLGYAGLVLGTVGTYAALPVLVAAHLAPQRRRRGWRDRAHQRDRKCQRLCRPVPDRLPEGPDRQLPRRGADAGRLHRAGGNFDPGAGEKRNLGGAAALLDEVERIRAMPHPVGVIGLLDQARAWRDEAEHVLKLMVWVTDDAARRGLDAYRAELERRATELEVEAARLAGQPKPAGEDGDGEFA